MLGERWDIERVRARLQVKSDQPDQGDERADAEVKCDLECGVVLLLAAPPNANHDERGHERQLVKEIKEEQVERSEGAEDAARHNEQQDVEFLLALFNLPGDTGGCERDNGPHQDQPNVNAVHTKLAGHAERFHP